MQYAAVLCRNWSNNCINMRSVAGVFLSEWAEADFCAILSVKNKRVLACKVILHRAARKRVVLASYRDA